MPFIQAEGRAMPRLIIACALALPAGRAEAQAAGGGPRLSGYVQARETLARGAGLTATINRARLSADGEIARGLAFKVSAELASGGGATTPYAAGLRDAFVRFERSGFSVWAGQFKTPFSGQFLTPLTHVETADRAAVVDALAPKRDIGLMAQYDWRGRAGAALGVFNGEGQNIGANRDSSMLVVARATAKPIGAVTLGADVARYRDSVRYDAEAGVAYAGFGLKGEYIRQHRRAVGRDDAGWFLLASYRVRPWLQLIAEQEDFERPSVPTFARNTATTIGANAYVVGDRVRLLANYVSRKVGTRKGALITQAQVLF